MAFASRSRSNSALDTRVMAEFASDAYDVAALSTSTVIERAGCSRAMPRHRETGASVLTALRARSRSRRDAMRCCGVRGSISIVAMDTSCYGVKDRMAAAPNLSAHDVSW